MHLKTQEFIHVMIPILVSLLSMDLKQEEIQICSETSLTTLMTIMT
jgi:hypothetical protein